MRRRCQVSGSVKLRMAVLLWIALRRLLRGCFVVKEADQPDNVCGQAQMRQRVAMCIEPLCLFDSYVCTGSACYSSFYAVAVTAVCCSYVAGSQRVHSTTYLSMRAWRQVTAQLANMGLHLEILMHVADDLPMARPSRSGNGQPEVPRYLRIKVTGRSDGVTKLETRIPAGFLTGSAASWCIVHASLLPMSGI